MHFCFSSTRFEYTTQMGSAWEADVGSICKSHRFRKVFIMYQPRLLTRESLNGGAVPQKSRHHLLLVAIQKFLPHPILAMVKIGYFQNRRDSDENVPKVRFFGSYLPGNSHRCHSEFISQAFPMGLVCYITYLRVNIDQAHPISPWSVLLFKQDMPAAPAGVQNQGFSQNLTPKSPAIPAGTLG